MNKIKLTVSLLFLFITVISLFIIFYNDIHLYENMEAFSYKLPDGDYISATYYKGDIDAGILILEGFGSDQITIKSIASEFSKIGYHVFTFDFTGHGRSSGKLNFNNARTDRLAKQILEALDIFVKKSSLSKENIYLLGHSMGSRAALQASTMLNADSNVGGLILLGTQLNLSYNKQSQFFTGTADTELEWVKKLSGTNPSTDILLISGSNDDILTPESALLLYNKLRSDKNNYYRELIITAGVLHNYEVYSQHIINDSITWVNNKTEVTHPYNNITSKRNILWLIAVFSMFISIVAGSQVINNISETIINIEILSIKRFMLTKVLLWFPAMLLSFITIGVIILIPIGVPVFNLIYVGFISAYGFLLIFLYILGKMPYIKGKIDFIKIIKQRLLNKRVFIGFLFSLLLLVLGIVFARSGIYFVIPCNDRIIWLILLSILTFPGFFIGNIEMEVVNKNVKFPIYKVLQMLIGLFPFFLQALLFLILGSYSGMIGAFHGLIILAYVIVSGNLIRTVSKNILLTSIVQSIMIQLLILPQGVLFNIF